MQTLTYTIGKDRRALVKDIQNFVIDFNDQGVKNWVQARQYERSMRQVFVNVNNDDGPFNLTGCNVWFEGVLPDKTHKILDAKHAVILDAQNGQFRFDMPAQAFAVAGSYVQAFFRIVRDGQSITTLEFDLEVLADKVISGLIPSDYLTPFEDLYDQLEQIVNNADGKLQDKLNEWNQKLQNLFDTLNKMGTDTQTLLQTLQNRIADLEEKIKQDGLFTEEEAKQLENRLALKMSTGFEHTYGTVDEMLSDQNLGAGMYVRTAGYYTVNDGGGAEYLVTSKEPLNYSEKLNNGLYAQLLYGSEPVNVLQFGIKNDASEDCSDIINQQTKTHALYFPAGKYLVDKQLDIYHNIKGDGGSGYFSKDNVGLTTLVSNIETTSIDRAQSSVSLIRNCGASTIISDLNLELFSNENGITDNGHYVTKLRNIFVANVSGACGVKIDRPGSRASIIENLYVDGNDKDEKGSIGLYYLTGTDELLSNFWSMGCETGIFAVCALFYGSNIHIWCGRENMTFDYYEAARAVQLNKSKAYLTNLYADTVRFVIGTNGQSYASINNLVWTFDDTIDGIMPEIGYDGIVDNKQADFIEVNGGFMYLPKMSGNNYLMNSDRLKLSNFLVTVPKEKAPEDYLSFYYRNYLPNIAMGYPNSYRSFKDGSTGKWLEVARIPFKRLGGITTLLINDSHVNEAEFKLDLPTGMYRCSNFGQGTMQLAYKVVNAWFVIYMKQQDKWQTNQVTVTSVGDMGPVNYDFIRITNEQEFPKLIQDDDTGLTHISMNGTWIESDPNATVKPNLVFGDSISAGTATTKPYHEILGTDLKTTFNNYAVGSTGYVVTTNDSVNAGNGEVGVAPVIKQAGDNNVLDKMKSIDAFNSCIIEAGTNDYGSNVSAEDFKTAVHNTLQYALTKISPSHILVITPFKRKGYETANTQGMKLADYSQIIKDEAKSFNIPCVDGFATGLDPENDTQNAFNEDGLHLNDTGHALLAKFLENDVESMLPKDA